MKKTLLFLSFITCLSFVFAQQKYSVLPANVEFPRLPDEQTSKKTTHQKSSVCIDTVRYLIQKGTSYPGVIMNNTTSARGIAQYFEAGQPITVHGFKFHCYNDSATTIKLICYMFDARPDSAPLQPIYATDTIYVQPGYQSYYNSNSIYTARFDTPVNFTGKAYTLAVYNLSNKNLVMYCNNWSTADGKSEWRASLLIGSSWSRSQNVTVGSVPFNSDAVFEPIVSFNVEAKFVTDSSCVSAGVPTKFFNSSPLMNTPVYNQEKFNNTRRSWWDFADGSPLVKAVDTTHTYAVNQDYNVMLYDTMRSWYGDVCGDVDTQTVTYQLPVSSFTFNNTNLQYNFTCTTTPTPNSVLWDFGDNQTSTQLNPTHTYATGGNYFVSLIVNNGCGNNFSGQNINAVNGINSIDKENGYQVYPNPAINELNIKVNSALPTNICVFDNLGKIVYSNPMNNAIKINTSTWTEGNYFVKISNDEITKVVKVNVIK